MHRLFRVWSIFRYAREVLRPLYLAVLSRLPPYLHAVLGYYRVHGRLPNLRAPRRFSEKIIWRKLYERDPRYPQLIDKILVKEYVAQRVGGELLIPTLAVYERPEELDFERPPLSRPPYVIKANHGWDMNLFVVDPAELGDARQLEAIRARLRSWLATDHSLRMREWAYSSIRRRLLVEPYLGPVNDHKFHVFHGRVYACELISNRFLRQRQEAIFDRDWRLIEANYGLPLYAGELPQKSVRERMVQIAEALAEGFDYLRVDLYVVGGTVKFGELTFYPGGGEERLRPVAWDRAFGEQWRLAAQALRK
jgi:hypothetical protein